MDGNRNSVSTFKKKVCVICRNPVVKRVKEGITAYNKKKTCGSKSCTNRLRSKRKREQEQRLRLKEERQILVPFPDWVDFSPYNIVEKRVTVFRVAKPNPTAVTKKSSIVVE